MEVKEDAETVLPSPRDGFEEVSIANEPAILP
jgi:hypothetical protein